MDSYYTIAVTFDFFLFYMNYDYCVLFIYSIILRALQIFAKVIHDKFTQEFEKEVCIHYLITQMYVNF